MFVVNLRKSLKCLERVYVSSDSYDILDVAFDYGAIPILRPSELTGDTPNVPVYQHAMTMMDGDSFMAVQANSPNIDIELMLLARDIMLSGVNELMTCHADGKPYGSIWAMTRERIENYANPYQPSADVFLVDPSIDIHTKEDYEKALCPR